jgi:hypothetical protein
MTSSAGAACRRAQSRRTSTPSAPSPDHIPGPRRACRPCPSRRRSPAFTPSAHTTTPRSLRPCSRYSLSSRRFRFRAPPPRRTGSATSRPWLMGVPRGGGGGGGRGRAPPLRRGSATIIPTFSKGGGGVGTRSAQILTRTTSHPCHTNHGRPLGAGPAAGVPISSVWRRTRLRCAPRSRRLHRLIVVARALAAAQTLAPRATVMTRTSATESAPAWSKSALLPAPPVPP